MKLTKNQLKSFIKKEYYDILHEKLSKNAPMQLKSTLRYITTELNKRYGKNTVKDYFVTPKINPNGTGYQIYTIQVSDAIPDDDIKIIIKWLMKTLRYFLKGSYRGSYNKITHKFNIVSR